MPLLKHMEQEQISQAEAARLKEVSRQYISSLRETGRLSTIYDESGCPTPYVWKHEVMAIQTLQRGRPKLSPEVKKERMKDQYGFEIGDKLLWDYTPKDGFGHTITIEGEVAKQTPQYVLLKILHKTSGEFVFRNVFKNELRRA